MHRMLFTIMFVLCSLTAGADDGIVAKVNSTTITASELREEVDRLIPRATFHGTVPEEKRNTFRGQALENLIRKELQYQDASDRKLKVKRKQIKNRLKQIRKRFKSKREYAAALQQAGITQDQLRERVKRDLLVERVIQKTVTEPAHMKDAELKDHYNRNKDTFQVPDSVRIRIISAASGEKARTIRARLKAGEDFGMLATRMSEDNYRVRGGDLGYVHRGRLLPEIEREAFTLGVGTASGLIRAEGKFFIIKVEDKKPEHQLSFEEARDKLKKELEEKRAAELMERWITDLRAKAKIEILMKR